MVYFFHSFTFRLLDSLHLKFVSYKHYVIWILFWYTTSLIWLYLLIGIFSPFTFYVIINVIGFKSPIFFFFYLSYWGFIFSYLSLSDIFWANQLFCFVLHFIFSLNFLSIFFCIILLMASVVITICFFNLSQDTLNLYITS